MPEEVVTSTEAQKPTKRYRKILVRKKLPASKVLPSMKSMRVERRIKDTLPALDTRDMRFDYKDPSKLTTTLPRELASPLNRTSPRMARNSPKKEYDVLGTLQDFNFHRNPPEPEVEPVNINSEEGRRLQVLHGKELEARKEAARLRKMVRGDRIYEGQQKRVIQKFEKQKRQWTRMKRALAKKSGKTVAQLNITRSEEYREYLEEIDLMVKSKPTLQATDKHWEMTLRNGGDRFVRIGNIFGALYCKVKQPEEILPESVRFVRPIQEVRLDETGKLGVDMHNCNEPGKGAASKRWRETGDARWWREKLTKRMKKFKPDTLDEYDGLEIQGTYLFDREYRLPAYSIPVIDRVPPTMIDVLELGNATLITEDAGAVDLDKTALAETEPTQDSTFFRLPNDLASTAPAITEEPRLCGPKAELSANALGFTTLTGESQYQTVTLQNTGSSVMYYTWKRADDSNRPDRLFYWARKTGVLLAGASIGFDFLFKSELEGDFSRQLKLVTVPTLPGVCLLELKARCDAPDLHEEHRTAMMLAMENSRKEMISRQASAGASLPAGSPLLMVDGVQTPEPLGMERVFYSANLEDYPAPNQLFFYPEVYKQLVKLKNAAIALYRRRRRNALNGPERWDHKVKTLRKLLVEGGADRVTLDRLSQFVGLAGIRPTPNERRCRALTASFDNFAQQASLLEIKAQEEAVRRQCARQCVARAIDGAWELTKAELKAEEKRLAAEKKRAEREARRQARIEAGEDEDDEEEEEEEEDEDAAEDAAEDEEVDEELAAARAQEGADAEAKIQRKEYLAELEKGFRSALISAFQNFDQLNSTSTDDGLNALCDRVEAVKKPDETALFGWGGVVGRACPVHLKDLAGVRVMEGSASATFAISGDWRALRCELKPANPIIVEAKPEEEDEEDEEEEAEPADEDEEVEPKKEDGVSAQEMGPLAGVIVQQLACNGDGQTLALTDTGEVIALTAAAAATQDEEEDDEEAGSAPAQLEFAVDLVGTAGRRVAQLAGCPESRVVLAVDSSGCLLSAGPAGDPCLCREGGPLDEALPAEPVQEEENPEEAAEDPEEENAEPVPTPRATVRAFAPVPFFADKPVAAVAVGSRFCLALSDAGDLFVWGEFGPWMGLGEEADDAGYSEPRRLEIPVPEPEDPEAERPTPPKVVAVAAGSSHALLLDENAEVWVFGTGVLGLPEDTEEAPKSASVPTKLEGLAGVTQIAAGTHHSLALDESGNVFSWGRAEGGVLGLGFAKQDPAPVEESPDEAPEPEYKLVEAAVPTKVEGLPGPCTRIVATPVASLAFFDSPLDFRNWAENGAQEEPQAEEPEATEQ